MKKGFEKILGSKFWWLALLAALVLINYIGTMFHYRIDLTQEKRYTLSKTSSDLIKKLDDDLEVNIFLKGEFPSGFRKLANSTAEFMDLLKDRNGSKVHYHFVSPQDEMPGTGKAWGDTLVGMGAVPINLTVQKKAGESSNIIFPVATLEYKGKIVLVNLYPGANGRISQEEINNAEALMEYQFVKALDKLTNDRKPGIGYAVGNGEPVDGRAMDIVQTLQNDYKFAMFNLQTQPAIPADMDVLMIVKPTLQFTEAEKFKLDQFVMNGGKLLCFIDNLIAEQDSLAFNKETIAYDRNLNLTDIFFRYGVRINPDLVMDLQCDMIPFVVGGTADNPQLDFLHWNYYPLLIPTAGNVLNRNMGYVSGRFVNSVDSIQEPGIKKTFLLGTSAHSRIISTPAIISLNENKDLPEDEKFKKNDIPVAMLLEGEFSSFYKNRVTAAQQDTLKLTGALYKPVSVPTKMIVVADGDMVLNDVMPQEGPLPMGWNKYTYREYQQQSEYGKYFVPAANREFLLNCAEYLVNNPAIAETRNKEIILRLLDSPKITKNKTQWQLINIALPVILILLAGLAYQQIRKKKYTRTNS